MKETIITAIALVLILEGIGPLLFPNKWIAYMQKLASEGADNLRVVGAMLVITGVLTLLFFT